MPSRTPKSEGPPQTVLDESDASLVAAAESVFADDIVSSEEEAAPDLSKVSPAAAPYDSTVGSERAGSTDSNVQGQRAIDASSTEESERIPDFGRPGMDVMVTVRGGGLYLPVRRRVGWMRGMPEPHPAWTIDTIAEKVVEGKFSGGSRGAEKVEGGYARYRANVFDESGRLIATGTKTEYSERFLDFVEKAETGAIGRALAVAGYGTEAAVDLDEGLEKERIADAPVTPSRPINITPSAIPGVRPGGRPARIENTQIKEIARLNKSLGLGFGLVTFLEAVKGEPMPALEAGKEQQQMLAFLETFTHEQGGEVVQQLTKVLKEQQAKAAEVNET